MDIYFNEILLLITLRHRIDFAATGHFPSKKKETYSNTFGASFPFINNVVQKSRQFALIGSSAITDCGNIDWTNGLLDK